MYKGYWLHLNFKDNSEVLFVHLAIFNNLVSSKRMVVEQKVAKGAPRGYLLAIYRVQCTFDN